MEQTQNKPINLTTGALLEEMQKVAGSLPDPRKGKNTMYSMKDVMMSAFSVFFLQNPSFLAHQVMMQNIKKRNNAKSLFGIQEIPSDNQIRNILDSVSPDNLNHVFTYAQDLLRRMGCFEKAGNPNSLRSSLGDLLVALDGTWYCASNEIACAKCLTKKESAGKTIYYHSVILPVIVTPGQKRAIPLQPEYIQPQDGQEKQDCETNGAKRWINGLGKEIAPLGITILGDDLYSRQPMIETIVANQLHYILVCKPESHGTVYEWIDHLESGVDIKTHVVSQWNGKYREIRTYRYTTDVPLRDSTDTLKTNWCEITITRAKDGKQIYHNTFITNHKITLETIEAIVVAGRTRWKVENECNNTLKTKGYCLEHNYGHGKKYLVSLLCGLTLIAFLFHTLLEMRSEIYQHIRTELPTRITFFNDLRALTYYTFFDSWESLFEFMKGGVEKYR